GARGLSGGPACRPGSRRRGGAPTAGAATPREWGQRARAGNSWGLQWAVTRPRRSFGPSRPPARRESPTRTPRTAREAACQALAQQAARFPDLLPLEPDRSALDA